MTSSLSRLSMLVAVLAVTAAIGASPAPAAGPYRSMHAPAAVDSHTGQPVNLPHIDHSVMAVRPHTVVASGSAGFDWSAAGIGALSAAVASIALMALVRDRRRRHEPTPA